MSFMIMQNDFDSFLGYRAASLIHRLAVSTGSDIETCASAVPELLNAWFQKPVV